LTAKAQTIVSSYILPCLSAVGACFMNNSTYIGFWKPWNWEITIRDISDCGTWENGMVVTRWFTEEVKYMSMQGWWVLMH